MNLKNQRSSQKMTSHPQADPSPPIDEKYFKQLSPHVPAADSSQVTSSNDASSLASQEVILLDNRNTAQLSEQL